MTELIANSPTPGSRVALTTLAAAQSSTTSLTFTMGAAAPAALQGASGDQFRCVIDSEIIIFDASKVSTTTWTALTRGAEGSTPATHNADASVFHDLTAAALQALISGGSGVSRTIVDVAYAASITPALDAGDTIFVVPVNGALQVNPPSGTPFDGQNAIFRFTQDATGHAITFVTGSTGDYAFSTTVTASNLSSSPSVGIRVITQWNAATERWEVLSINSGF